MAAWNGLRFGRHQHLLQAIVVRGLAALLAFSTLALVSRVLGPSEFGVYSFALAVSAFLSLAAASGLDQLSARELASGTEAFGDASVDEFNEWSVRSVYRAGLVLAMVVVVVLLLTPANAFVHGSTSVAIAVLAVPALGITRLCRGRLQAVGQTPVGIFLEMGFSNLVLFLMITGARFAGFVLDLPQVIAAFVIASLAAALVSASAAKLRFRWGHLPHPAVLGWRRQARSFTLYSFALFALLQGDLVLAPFLGGPSSAGSYAVAARVSLVMAMAIQPVQQVFAPRFALAWNADGGPGVTRVAVACGRWMVVVLAPLALFLMLFPVHVLALFGASDSNSLVVLRILVLAFVVQVAFGPVMVLMAMVGEEMAAFRLTLGAALAGALAAILGSFWFGVLALAGGRVLAALIMGIAGWRFLAARGVSSIAWLTPRRDGRDSL